jgi:hypothetical protein
MYNSLMPPLHPTTPPTFHTQPRHGITNVTVLRVLTVFTVIYIPKTMCDFLRNDSAGITTTVHSKNITLFSLFLSHKRSFLDTVGSEARILND